MKKVSSRASSLSLIIFAALIVFSPPTVAAEVCYLKANEGSGNFAHDASGNMNDGLLNGSVSWVAGVKGTALSFNGRSDRVVIADSPTLDLSAEITLAAWVRPRVKATQYMVKKARFNSVDGYELSLSSDGRAFVRFNQASAGIGFHLNSLSRYPTDGATWMHVAATYDGAEIRLYIDGVLEGALPAPGLSIGTNNLDLLLGMQDNGKYPFNGDLDEVQIAAIAMSAEAVAALASANPNPTIDGIATWQSNLLLQEISTATVGEKPQSKAWKHNGTWWMVMPDDGGESYVWRLDVDLWNKVLVIDDREPHGQADTIVHSGQGDIVHILLAAGQETKLVSVEYVPGSPGTYKLWTQRPASANVMLAESAETATVAIDSAGIMWVASDGSQAIEVRYSPFPYSSWLAEPIILVQGVTADDIAAITTLGDRSIGVMWSDHASERFGFKVHLDGDDPLSWSADEVPASQSASNVGGGMADDHINLAVTSDGVLFAAVKTSFDTPGYPKICFLRRHTDGTWDQMYEVDVVGTRPIVVVNEVDSFITVLYSSDEFGGAIIYKESSLSTIQFGRRKQLLVGNFYTNVSSAGDSFVDDLVVIASGTVTNEVAKIDGVRLQRPTQH